MNHRNISLTVIDALLQAHKAAGEQPGNQGLPAAGGPRPPFSITISREAGALGTAVAAEVGRLLGWPVYDREILEKIAQELKRPAHQLAAVDERPVSWLEDSLAMLLAEYPVSADTYLKYLLATVRGLGAAGRCVIVGRAANFILPAATTVRVRLVAEPADRARVVADRLGVGRAEAEAWVEKTDRERLRFVKRLFNKDAADPHQYDLVLNTSRLTVEEAAGVIVQHLLRWEGRPTAAPASPAPPAGASVPTPALA
jgi:cytidylate kinase